MTLNVVVSLFYSLNYKPNFKRNKFSSSDKIFCKNFFFFIFFIEYFFFKKNKQFKGDKTIFSMVVLKKNKNYNPILRAPNRYKKAQYKIFKEYYEIRFLYSFIIVVNNYVNKLIIFNSLNDFNFFESSLVFLKKKKISIKELNFFNNINVQL